MGKIEASNEERNKINWVPFLRQFLVCSGVWMTYFKHGLVVGAPTVFVPQIRRETNSTDVISPEMVSWLSSIIGFSAFVFVIFFAILSRCMGRKIPFILASANSFLAFLVIYCSSNVTQILISQVMQGFSSAAQVVVSLIIVTEYTSPKYRGLFLTMKCATLYWGIWVANAVGTFFHWKTIGLVGLVCAAYTLTTVLFWPESPYWLAARARFQDCEKSHRWLKGCDEDSEKELKNLINTQKEYLNNGLLQQHLKNNKLKDLYLSITAREFYKPIGIALMTGFLSVFSGKLVCTVYSLDIIKKITGNESTAYIGMLILDGITVMSMYMGCVLCKFLKRRMMILVTSSIAITFLFTISLYLYFIKLSFIIETKYVSISLLLLFSITVSCGPLIMSSSIFGELIPLRSRNLAACVIALTGKAAFAIPLKVAPYMFEAFGLHGTFLAFGISSSINLLLIYKYLPETKDKTLQEISEVILGPKTTENSKKAETSKLMAL